MQCVFITDVSCLLATVARKWSLCVARMLCNTHNCALHMRSAAHAPLCPKHLILRPNSTPFVNLIPASFFTWLPFWETVASCVSSRHSQTGRGSGVVPKGSWTSRRTVASAMSQWQREWHSVRRWICQEYASFVEVILRGMWTTALPMRFYLSAWRR
jgi:hypothetical protein